MIVRQYRVLGFTAVAGGLLMIAGQLLFGSRRPTTNIVMIAVDGLRADALTSSAGAPGTPNLERLRKDGIHFTSIFSHSPDTLPSHTSLLSGRYPADHGVTLDGQEIAQDLPLLPEWLRGMGYQTRAVVGHDELNPIGTRRGLDRAFEYYSPSLDSVAPAEDVTRRAQVLLGGVDVSKPFFLYVEYSDTQAPYAAHGEVIHEATVHLDNRQLESVRTSELGFWTAEVELAPGPHVLDLESKAEFELESFSCSGPSQDLTPRYLAGKPGEATKQVRISLQNTESAPIRCELRLWVHDVPEVADVRWRYKKEVEFVDDNIGAIINELRRRNLYDDCLIVLTAAHGESLGEHGQLGHGEELYDELLRVPLIIKLPFAHPMRDELQAQRARLGRQVDVVPTLLKVLRAPSLPDAEGVPLVSPDERLLRAEVHGRNPQYGLRDEQFKLVYRPRDGSFRMYNLIGDPAELDDAFQLQGHLRREWQEMLKEIARELPLDPPAARPAVPARTGPPDETW